MEYPKSNDVNDELNIYCIVRGDLSLAKHFVVKCVLLL